MADHPQSDQPLTALGRSFLAATLTASAHATGTAEDDGWMSLFNGTSLEGWSVREAKDAKPDSTAFRVEEGFLVAENVGKEKKLARLFYEGPVNGAGFTDFELTAKIRLSKRGSSGIMFHIDYPGPASRPGEGASGVAGPTGLEAARAAHAPNPGTATATPRPRLTSDFVWPTFGPPPALPRGNRHVKSLQSAKVWLEDCIFRPRASALPPGRGRGD